MFKQCVGWITLAQPQLNLSATTQPRAYAHGITTPNRHPLLTRYSPAIVTRHPAVPCAAAQAQAAIAALPPGVPPLATR